MRTVKRRLLPLLTLLWLAGAIAAPASASPPDPRPAARFSAAADPYSLIAEVNALRGANGLPPYQTNPILMSVAQGQSDYQAAIGTVTHYGADGSRPFQRALAAGYPVGGDLSLGGFYSENIMAGTNLSVSEAVQAWQGDAPHLNTMLSPNLTEVGAGVAVVGDYVYYTLDAARPSGSGSAPAYTPPPEGEAPLAPAVTYIAPVVANTPGADGSILHVVQPGETLWAIAAAYDLSVDDLLTLNGLAESAVLYPGDSLIVRPAFTPTPVTPTATSTREPAPTRIPTLTASPSPSPQPTAAPARASAIPGERGALVVMGIVVLALGLAGVVTWLSGRPRD